MLAILISSPLPHLPLAPRAHPTNSPALVRITHRTDEPWINTGDEVHPRAPKAGHDGAAEALVPGVNVALHEQDFGVWVGSDEVLGESNGWRIGANGAVRAEELVPLLASEGGAFGEEFGVEGRVPDGAVADVGEEQGRVVAGVAKDAEGCLHA